MRIQPSYIAHAYQLAKQHFRKEITSFIPGKSLFIHPKHPQLKGCTFEEAQQLTGALIHGARNPQPLLEAAQSNGELPPKAHLHIVTAEDASVARSIAGPSGAMVLINKAGVCIDAYGNLQIPDTEKKVILGIWEKDQGRIAPEIAAYRAIKVFFQAING